MMNENEDDSLFGAFQAAGAGPAVAPEPAQDGVVIPAAVKKTAELRTAHLTLRLTPSFKQAMLDAADRRGIKVTEFIETLVQYAIEADRKAGLID